MLSKITLPETVYQLQIIFDIHYTAYSLNKDFLYRTVEYAFYACRLPESKII